MGAQRTTCHVPQLIVILYCLGSLISFVVLTSDFLVNADTGVFSFWANNTILYSTRCCACVRAGGRAGGRVGWLAGGRAGGRAGVGAYAQTGESAGGLVGGQACLHAAM